MNTNGSLALVGSGEYLPQMAEFEKGLIDDGLANGKKPIYVQIPTAAGQEVFCQSLAGRMLITQSYLKVFQMRH